MYLTKRPGSPLQNTSKRLNTGILTLSVTCTQDLCQCKSFRQVLNSKQNLEDLEVLAYYIKFFLSHQHHFIPIRCFINSVSAFIADIGEIKDKIAATSFLLSPLLINHIQFINVLEKHDIFKVVLQTVIERNKADLDINELNILHWYSQAQPSRFLEFPQLFPILTSNIDNSENTTTTEILKNLTKLFPGTVLFNNERLLDVLTKNIALTHLHLDKLDFHRSNVATFINCMRLGPYRKMAAEFGCIELFLTIFEGSWNTTLFDLLDLVIDVESVAKLILRNKTFLEKSWDVSDDNRFRFMSLVRKLSLSESHRKEIVMKLAT